MVTGLCLKWIFGSKSATKLHWTSHNYSATMLVHFPTLSRLWIGWGGQNVSTGLSVPLRVHTCKVKSNPWDFLMPLSICDCGQSCTVWDNTQHRGQTGYRWPPNSPAAPKMRVCLLTCTCIRVIVWSLQSFNPLICWTLEITCSHLLARSEWATGLNRFADECTHAHSQTHTYTNRHTHTFSMLVIYSTRPASLQANEDWCSSFQDSQVFQSNVCINI